MRFVRFDLIDKLWIFAGITTEFFIRGVTFNMRGVTFANLVLYCDLQHFGYEGVTWGDLPHERVVGWYSTGRADLKNRQNFAETLGSWRAKGSARPSDLVLKFQISQPQAAK